MLCSLCWGNIYHQKITLFRVYTLHAPDIAACHMVLNIFHNSHWANYCLTATTCRSHRLPSWSMPSRQSRLYNSSYHNSVSQSNSCFPGRRLSGMWTNCNTAFRSTLRLCQTCTRLSSPDSLARHSFASMPYSTAYCWLHSGHCQYIRWGMIHRCLRSNTGRCHRMWPRILP